MKITKKAVGLAALALSASLVTGCGNSTDAYCNDLEATVDELGSLTGTDADSMEKAFDAISDLADDAPDEVKDEWQVLDKQMEAIDDALDEAGLEFSDLGELSTGQLPEGVTEEQLTELGEKLQNLSGDEVQEAADTISEHAKDECDVDLNAS
ncbi:hypothetical protein [Nocardioides massiliensis]|uniref:Outer membrane murein-binding lipoprotein Lpp n=1 Tax=Nocardioides massiliensis TaxID=1325935 RepID=A0ABT9NJ58_9ACTN|nr:hypothetical protein [Nocardioides massiliensis]MDP9820450.1 outer membrane murein-binding lipoprotein Lpp [Nocardioides massiliensis]